MLRTLKKLPSSLLSTGTCTEAKSQAVNLDVIFINELQSFSEYEINIEASLDFFNVTSSVSLVGRTSTFNNNFKRINLSECIQSFECSFKDWISCIFTFQANSFLVPDRNVSFWISAVGQLEAEMEMRFVALLILNDNINLLTMISMT